ncbi:Uncharacterised protein [Bordetella pertussis]|nr:Uncharacterised protein [Bordetella pertussis]
MMARHWAPKVATRPMLYWPNSPPSTRTGRSMPIACRIPPKK